MSANRILVGSAPSGNEGAIVMETVPPSTRAIKMTAMKKPETKRRQNNMSCFHSKKLCRNKTLLRGPVRDTMQAAGVSPDLVGFLRPSLSSTVDVVKLTTRN